MDYYEINPFQELYVTDTADPNVFVQLFSDYPVRHAHAIFRPGNVVVKGAQGSGKSMLLNLLRPQIRLAYAEARVTFPVPASLPWFVGAGVNLSRCGALDIGQRPISHDDENSERLFPLYFADFLNYYIVRDLIESTLVMRNNPGAFGSIVKPDRLGCFAKMLSEEDCWFGTLRGANDIDGLCQRIDRRIAEYRAFHVGNPVDLQEITETKTTIGEPIARTAQCLRSAGVISENTPIFVRIDQIERLSRSDSIRPVLGRYYRQIINKALGTRDLRVSYRVGTRLYAWEDNLVIYGSEDRLEHLRDFRIIDLNGILSRKENTKTWIFPKFAEDAFARRLRLSHHVDRRSRDLIVQVFGHTAGPAERSRKYCTNATPEKALHINENWPREWREFLLTTFAEDPLEAFLASAWARQRGRHGKPGDRLKTAPPVETRPWKRAYWRKERIRQCLLQIQTRGAQRIMEWSGKDRILALSSGNITVFLSICHEAWEAFLCAERHKKTHERQHPVVDGIGPDLQSVGIYTASAFWYDKIAEQRNGDDRRRFVDALGRQFKSWLLEDDAMSYPGHNGFSLADRDLETYPWLCQFLEDSVAYGDLYATKHTTKRRDRLPRTKWYLNPILSPILQIPESHVKEPFYADIENIVWWLRDAHINICGDDEIQPKKPRRGHRGRNTDPGLFS